MIIDLKHTGHDGFSLRNLFNIHIMSPSSLGVEYLLPDKLLTYTLTGGLTFGWRISTLLQETTVASKMTNHSTIIARLPTGWNSNTAISRKLGICRARVVNWISYHPLLLLRWLLWLSLRLLLLPL